MTGEDPAPAFGLRPPDYLRRMHDQLDELAADRDRMGQLVQVAIEIGSNLELDGALQRIVTAARTMTGARYGAIGAWGPDGTLASFIHSGAEDAAALIGHPPAGKGILGLTREENAPVRLTNLTEHPAAVGFPEHHPAMRAFLGMPITIRDVAFGSLYIADDRPGFEFSESDEITARALASAAAVAIDNARLFDRVRAAARWVTASREIATALLSNAPPVSPLQVIVDRAMELADAEQAIVLVPADPAQENQDVDTLVVSASVGKYATEVLGQHVPVDGSTTGEVFRTGEPRITAVFRHPIQSFTDVGERPAIVMPLRSGEHVVGVIAVAREASAAPFDATYLTLVRDFADHSAIALMIARARQHTRELTILADRERIARDLHDQVIQRVFAVGMDLQGAVARQRSPELAGRLTRCVDELQAVIDEIRFTIFDLQHPLEGRRSLARRIQDTVGRLTEDRDVAVTLRMSGPLSVVDETLADHVEAVVVEGLSNAVRHSGARAITVEVGVGDDLCVEIADDGHGIPAANERISGLGNLAQRAKESGGDFTIGNGPTGGARLTWRAQLSEV